MFRLCVFHWKIEGKVCSGEEAFYLKLKCVCGGGRGIMQADQKATKSTNDGLKNCAYSLLGCFKRSAVRITNILLFNK